MVFGSCGLNIIGVVVALVLMKDDAPYATLGTGCILIVVGITAMLTVPHVVVDLDTPQFLSAKFDWWKLWLSGCDGMALALGPAVAMEDTELLSQLCEDGTKSGLTLLQPPASGNVSSIPEVGA
jgi:hypothetical protein